MDFDIEVEDVRKPLPDFSYEEEILKIRLAEDAWNNKDPKNNSHSV